jgi:hypothetical protein
VYLKKLGMRSAVSEAVAATLQQHFETLKRETATGTQDQVRRNAVFLKYLGITPRLDNISWRPIDRGADVSGESLARSVRQYAQLKYLDLSPAAGHLANAYERLKGLQADPAKYVRTAALLKHYAGLQITLTDPMKRRLAQYREQLRAVARGQHNSYPLISFAANEALLNREVSETRDDDIITPELVEDETIDTTTPLSARPAPPPASITGAIPQPRVQLPDAPRSAVLQQPVIIKTNQESGTSTKEREEILRELKDTKLVRGPRPGLTVYDAIAQDIDRWQYGPRGWFNENQLNMDHFLYVDPDIAWAAVRAEIASQPPMPTPSQSRKPWWKIWGN